jgi:hypothetical protein
LHGCKDGLEVLCPNRKKKVLVVKETERASLIRSRKIPRKDGN